MATNFKMKTSLGFYILSFLSKPTCIFFPIIYLTNLGFKSTKKIKIIAIIILLITILISGLAASVGTLQPHIAELSVYLRVLNAIKNLIIGWITIFYPLPFFPNYLIAAIYTLFISLVIYVLLKTYKIKL